MFPSLFLAPPPAYTSEASRRIRSPRPVQPSVALLALLWPCPPSASVSPDNPSPAFCPVRYPPPPCLFRAVRSLFASSTDIAPPSPSHATFHSFFASCEEVPCTRVPSTGAPSLDPLRRMFHFSLHLPPQSTLAPHSAALVPFVRAPPPSRTRAHATRDAVFIVPLACPPCRPLVFQTLFASLIVDRVGPGPGGSTSMLPRPSSPFVVPFRISCQLPRCPVCRQETQAGAWAFVSLCSLPQRKAKWQSPRTDRPEGCAVQMRPSLVSRPVFPSSPVFRVRAVYAPALPSLCSTFVICSFVRAYCATAQFTR